MITGAAKRLGAAMAHFLAERGHSVILHVRRADDVAQAVVHAIRTAGGRCVLIEGDLTDISSLENLFVEALEAFGQVDHLINNASRFAPLSIEETDFESFDSLMALHNSAPFFLSRALYLHLKGRQAHGSVINMVDATLSAPKASRPAYYMAKGALLAQTKALAVALAPTVRVNAISPGPVLQGDTDGLYFERMATILPLQKTGSPHDICKGVEYLINSPFVTGTELVIDGGQQLL